MSLTKTHRFKVKKLHCSTNFHQNFYKVSLHSAVFTGSIILRVVSQQYFHRVGTDRVTNSGCLTDIFENNEKIVLYNIKPWKKIAPNILSAVFFLF